MKYENEFGTIKVLEDSKFKNKTIAVAMSGGADSTLLCYLIANTIQEQDLNITIQPYNGLDLWAPGDGKQIPKIIYYIRNKFPFVTINWPLSVVFDTEGGEAPSKHTYIKPMSIMLEEKIVDYTIHGISMGPPKDVQNSFKMTQGHPEELVRLPGGLYWEELERQEDDLAPYKTVDKRFIIQAYNDHDITDLLDMTASCIVPGGCGNTCWWCQERQWALDEVNKG
jgi:hypothetical protein